ncbi:MAG: hypothetical protein FJW97_09995 [Actinobacteria bacterium]|nr:hypothetical protein [Actinomycetota bacterium]
MGVVQDLGLELFSRSSAMILGLLLFIATTTSLLRTAVVPRALHSGISQGVATGVRGIFWGVARLRKDYVKRDGILAWTGPMIIVAWLLSWLFLYVIAYGLWIYGLHGGKDLWQAMQQSGSSLFTLGFAAPQSADSTIIDFLAAATGPIVIALLIGFLPTIYGSYIDREVEVTIHGSFAGQPAWGPELLARIAMTNQIDRLPDLYETWGRWAAQIRLTHVTYPVLIFVRSPRATRNWLVSLLSTLDAASLQLAVNRTLPRAQAISALMAGSQTLEVLYATLFSRSPLRSRLRFRGLMISRPSVRPFGSSEVPGVTRKMVAVEIASASDTAEGLPTSIVENLEKQESKTIDLTREDLDHAVAVLKDAGFPVEVEGDEAWQQFQIARSRYEYTAYMIAEAIDAVPAPWSGPRKIPTPIIWPTLATNVMPNVPGQFADDPPPSA